MDVDKSLRDSQSDRAFFVIMASRPRAVRNHQMRIQRGGYRLLALHSQQQHLRKNQSMTGNACIWLWRKAPGSVANGIGLPTQ